LLGRLKGVVLGAAVIHDDDRERAGQVKEVIDDPGNDIAQIRCLVEGGQEKGNPVPLRSSADFVKAGAAFQLGADALRRRHVAERKPGRLLLRAGHRNTP
jgi:hypothetical protein